MIAIEIILHTSVFKKQLVFTVGFCMCHKLKDFLKMKMKIHM